MSPALRHALNRTAADPYSSNGKDGQRVKATLYELAEDNFHSLAMYRIRFDQFSGVVWCQNDSEQRSDAANLKCMHTTKESKLRLLVT